MDKRSPHCLKEAQGTFQSSARCSSALGHEAAPRLPLQDLTHACPRAPPLRPPTPRPLTQPSPPNAEAARPSKDFPWHQTEVRPRKPVLAGDLCAPGPHPHPRGQPHWALTVSAHSLGPRPSIATVPGLRTALPLTPLFPRASSAHGSSAVSSVRTPESPVQPGTVSRSPVCRQNQQVQPSCPCSDHSAKGQRRRAPVPTKESPRFPSKRPRFPGFTS